MPTREYGSASWSPFQLCRRPSGVIRTDRTWRRLNSRVVTPLESWRTDLRVWSVHRSIQTESTTGVPPASWKRRVATQIRSPSMRTVSTWNSASRTSTVSAPSIRWNRSTTLNGPSRRPSGVGFEP